MYYMTVEELTALLPSVFTFKELLACGWADYTNSDKEAILGRAEGFIDSLKYKGRYNIDYQQHAFPRVLGTGYVVEKDDERVLKALCYIVFDLLKADKIGSKKADRIQQGVKSISTGGVTESYGELKDVKIVSDNYVNILGFCLFSGVL